jgi:hypothetical protein
MNPSAKPQEDPTGSPLPAWDSFQQDYIEAAVPVYVVIRQDPVIRIFADSLGRKLGADFAISEEGPLPPSPLAEVFIGEKRDGPTRFVEISTSTPELHKHFYILLGEIVALVINEGIHPLSAFRQCLDRWQSLLRGLTLMTEEQQLGLLGELWTLERLIPTTGFATLDTWTGHERESHDFRLGHNEIEVKVTRNAKRIHLIHGLGQLQPSVGRKLFLLSLQVASAGPGSGFSLPERIHSLLQAFERWPDSRQRFLKILEDCHRFFIADERHYPRRWQLRTKPTLVPVVDGCPRLVPDALNTIPPAYFVGRISGVSYFVDIDGLGYPDGDQDFLSILPG